MHAPRLYSDLAPLWTLVSPPEGYAAEAVHWRETLRAHLGEGRHHLLELGVGGGNNLSHLTDEFDATAVDLSEAMLANSRRLNPRVTHHVGDMRSVRLGRTFDAVVIHDAINYLTSEDDLRRTFGTASVHLRPGGLLVCAPDWYRETFRGPRASLHGPRGSVEGGGPSVTFVEYAFDADPSDTTMQVVYLFLVHRGGEVEVVEDHHTLGLFQLGTWLAQIEKAGFTGGRRPYPVHADGREGWILTGVRR